MKPTSSFRMSKQTKRFMALLPFKDEHERGAFKRSSIQAQLAAESAAKAKLDKSNRDD